MKIFFKGVFIPVGDVKITVVNPEREAVSYQENRITLSKEGGEITAIKEQGITSEEYDYLLDKDTKLPRNEHVEGYLVNQYEAVRTILKYIRVFDGVFELDN